MCTHAGSFIFLYCVTLIKVKIFSNLFLKWLWNKKRNKKQTNKRKKKENFSLCFLARRPTPSFPAPRPLFPFGLARHSSFFPAHSPSLGPFHRPTARGLLPSSPFFHRWRPGPAFFSHCQHGPTWQRPHLLPWAWASRILSRQKSAPWSRFLRDFLP